MNAKISQRRKNMAQTMFYKPQKQLTINLIWFKQYYLILSLNKNFTPNPLV